MNTVLERNEESIVVNKSEFIAIVFHISSLEVVNEYLKIVKKEYPKAKHYCYAYILGDKKKGFDDGEPAKSAGRPLLELLEKREMDEVLLVVVRYFGGVLLGASRLMSTYIEAGVRVLDSSDILLIKTKYVYNLRLSYKDFDTLKRVMKKEDISLENVRYEDKINVDLLADSDIAEQLTNMFPNIELTVMGLKKVYGKKYD